MEHKNNGFILGVVAVIAVFYFLITSHENKIDRMQKIIEDQDETMQLQTEAIQAQRVQNQYLLQFYHAHNSPVNSSTYD